MNFLLSEEVTWDCGFGIDRNDEFDLDISVDHGMSQFVELPMEPELSVEELPDTIAAKGKVSSLEVSLDE